MPGEYILKIRVFSSMEAVPWGLGYRYLRVLSLNSDPADPLADNEHATQSLKNGVHTIHNEILLA